MTGVRSQRRRLTDLFRAAADQDLFAAYCLGVETTNGAKTSHSNWDIRVDLPAKRNLEILNVSAISLFDGARSAFKGRPWCASRSRRKIRDGTREKRWNSMHSQIKRRVPAGNARTR